MKRSDIFKSSYYKAEDFADGPANFTIKAVREGLVGIGEDKSRKCIVDVVEEDKSFVLNLTNFNALAEAFGEETDDWEAHKFRARRAMVQFQGKSVPAIRLRAVTNAVAKAPPPPPDDNDDGDDVEDAEYAG
jgi:hypothetical protein